MLCSREAAALKNFPKREPHPHTMYQRYTTRGRICGVHRSFEGIRLRDFSHVMPEPFGR